VNAPHLLMSRGVELEYSLPFVIYQVQDLAMRTESQTPKVMIRLPSRYQLSSSGIENKNAVRSTRASFREVTNRNIQPLSIR